jgi:hypothetical protein
VRPIEDPRTSGEPPPGAPDATVVFTRVGGLPAASPSVRPDRRSDDTIVLPLEASATAVIPVVAGETAVIAAIQGNPDDTVAKGAAKDRSRQRGYTWATRVGRAPEVLALSACGVVLVALGYVGGRSGASWAGAAYWAGQLLVFVPVVVRMLSGRLAGTGEAFALVIGLAVNQYFQKWLYSPDLFRFPDELQHWTATGTVMHTGRLFMPDYGLPVAVHFPGLEEIGAAVASMTGLSVTNAGLIVAGVGHLTFVGALFMVVRSTGASPALAGTTCVLYATALHYLFFDSMYIYQTAALPFLMLAIWASRKWRAPYRVNLPYAVLCLLAVAVTTVTHHVTAVVLAGTLLMIGLCEAVFGRRRRWAVLALAAAAGLIVCGWFVFVAHDVFSYLGPPLRGILADARSMFGGGGSGGGGHAPAVAFWQLAVQGIGLLALFALFCRAILVSWRSTAPLDPWRAAVLVGSFVFFVTTAIRFVGERGPELSGRAGTFAYVPMAMVAAGVLTRWAPQLRARRTADTRQRATGSRHRRPIILPPVVLGTAVAVVLLIGARAGGWPPQWEYLPGPYLVAGFERSIDAPGISAAKWTSDWLGPGHRVAADITGVTLVASFGGQDPVGDASRLYYDPTWGLDDAVLLQKLAVDYVWVDERMSTQLPVSGAYFRTDPRTGELTAPIPSSNLTKFNDIVGISLYYDNGNIRIYDMGHV